MQPPAGLPHTHPRPVHWLLTALGLAAVLTGAALLGPGDATAEDAPSPPFAVAPDPTAVRYPLDCGPVGTEVADRAVADLDGDERPETVAVVHCRAGAGTPPDGVYVLAAGKGTGAPPRVVATLVDPARHLNVGRFRVTGDTVSATLLGYSARTVPRCCPDLRRPVEWRWRDGQFETSTRPVTGRA
ncbi:hypothetical protein [Streptomyces huiliensis]|uniref:hypothetical protein n=1 Tax=Streptomyces huiliensis TaxID=2876027 RepID=UPI001CBE86E9|nr:hypothetical protein [Streptomyces huiliensis]MBZ4320203.1 hypothetical protein [Streptomyces huiliensis]